MYLFAYDCLLNRVIRSEIDIVNLQLDLNIWAQWLNIWQMMPVDTGDQVMYTVGQTDGHNSPDYTMSCAEYNGTELGLKQPY